MEKEVDWAVVRRVYEAGTSVRDCCAKFGMSARAWRLAVIAGDLPAPPPRELLPSEKRSLIDELFREGYSHSMVAAELGMSKATISYHARRFGIPVRDDFARRYDWEEIQAAYSNGMSAAECRLAFGFSKASWSKAVARGDITPRDHRIPLDQLLVRGRRTNRTHLKARLVDAGLKENRCEECGITEWRGDPLNMQLHHRNGDGLDNRIENLEFLCANCHSLTDTWGGRNGRRKPSSEAA
jgi:transposase-like protein